MTNSKVKKMTLIAILGAVAGVMMYFSFPIPIAPAFYKLDFSEVVVLIGAFSMGPLAGVGIEGIKIFVGTLLNSTTTGYIGELANFLMGCALVVPAALFYQKQKSKNGAIVGLVVGSVAMVLAGALLNFYVLLPMYSNMGFPMEAIVAMGTKITPWINDQFTFVLFATTPFNFVKTVSVTLMTLVLYKRVSSLLK